MTKSLYKYLAYKTKNCWHSIDAPFNIVSSQYLLPSVIVWAIIWTYWLLFCQVETQPFGQAEPSNTLAWVALILLKLKYLAVLHISLAILVYRNKYTNVTAQYSPIKFLQVKLSLKQHIEPGVNILTRSVLCHLDSHIPPCFHCSDRHEPLFSLFLLPLCWPNESGNILWGTHNPVLWAFWRLDAILKLCICCVICIVVVFTGR